MPAPRPAFILDSIPTRQNPKTRPTLKKAPDGETAPILTFIGNEPRHPAASSPSSGGFFLFPPFSTSPQLSIQNFSDISKRSRSLECDSGH
ncbi:MAG: hypothetical protein ACOVSW_25135 [Candidatus Kapaibacteriota bacterium]